MHIFFHRKTQEDPRKKYEINMKRIKNSIEVNFKMLCTATLFNNREKQKKYADITAIRDSKTNRHTPLFN